MLRTEELVLSSLVNNEEYMRKVIPHMKAEYFDDVNERRLFAEIKTFIDKFNARPTLEALTISLGKATDLTQESYETLLDLSKMVKSAEPDQSLDFLVQTSESWCQERALVNALNESVGILAGEGNKTKQEIPDILSEALRVSFDTAIGHDYIMDVDERFAYYHDDAVRVESGIDYINKVTNGGYPNKTLNIFLAGTNVGKTLIMCSEATSMLLRGLNVLYITMEMGQEEIGKRIDQNALDLSTEDLMQLEQGLYKHRFDQRVAMKTHGKLIIKEYPTASAHVGHFRHLIKELRIKKNFVPQVVFVDYLGICSSARTRMGGSINSYTFVKMIAEELRGLAKEFDVPFITGAQSNRGGQSATELDLEDTAESFGLPQTADFMLGITETEELAELGQFLCKQLKNRYRDKGKNRRFVIGVDKDKQRLFDLDESAQDFLKKATVDSKDEAGDDTPVFDRGSFGSRDKNTSPSGWDFGN